MRVSILLILFGLLVSCKPEGDIPVATSEVPKSFAIQTWNEFVFKNGIQVPTPLHTIRFNKLYTSILAQKKTCRLTFETSDVKENFSIDIDFKFDPFRLHCYILPNNSIGLVFTGYDDGPCNQEYFLFSSTSKKIRELYFDSNEDIGSSACDFENGLVLAELENKTEKKNELWLFVNSKHERIKIDESTGFLGKLAFVGNESFVYYTETPNGLLEKIYRH
jgi:hypothetical protein